MTDIASFAEQFFAPEKPPRDPTGRPLLIPRGVQVADENRVSYSRASSLGHVLEEDSFLWKWKMRGLARGLASSMDLVRLAAAETYHCGFVEDVKANRASGRRLDQVIDRALDRAGIAEKADYGTAIHMRTEPGNDGVDPDERQAAEVQSCLTLWADLGVVNIATEVFTANDTTMSAGTFDHLSYIPTYGIVITDKKTSKRASSTYDVQLASYANSDVYDPDTDERLSLEEYVERLGWDPTLINRDVGIIWWVKNGRTEARYLDLHEGWEAAKTAAWIRDSRRTKGVAKNVTKTIAADAANERMRLMLAIGEAQTIHDLHDLWNNHRNQAVWTGEHTAAATERKGALT